MERQIARRINAPLIRADLSYMPFDLHAPFRAFVLVTVAKMNKQKTRKKDYPDITVGSKLAAEARKLANSLSDEDRAESLEEAKSLIYGRARHKQAADLPPVKPARPRLLWRAIC